VTDVLEPQFVVIVTVPPDDGTVEGLTLTEQLDGGGDPACVQLTVMLPEPSAVAVNDDDVQTSCVANAGRGATKNPPEATAAASTRLMLRLICMVYLENRRHVAAIARGTHCVQALRHMSIDCYDGDILPGRHPSHGRLPRTNGSQRMVVRPLTEPSSGEQRTKKR